MGAPLRLTSLVDAAAVPVPTLSGDGYSSSLLRSGARSWVHSAAGRSMEWTLWSTAL
jgi:hypothetical protein